MLVAAYVRVSTEEQAEKDLSVPAQKSRIAAYCQSQNWSIYNFYVDDGYTSTNMERPGLKKLISDCRAKKVQVVVVVKLDRISRRQKDVLYLLEDVFEVHGVGFKSVTQAFDTTTAFGKASIGMLAVFAQLERDQLIERIVDTKLEAAKQGRFQGGAAPYGYRHNPLSKSLEVDEEQAPVVKKIYERYLSGAIGFRALADELNQQKILAPKAKKWNQITVRKILTSPAYIGMTPYYDQVFPGKHPAIVSKEMFDQVQFLLGGRGDKFKTAPSAQNILSGLLYCGECGARLRMKNCWQNHPKIPKRVIRYYVCYSQEGHVEYLVKRANCKCGYKHADKIDAQVVSYIKSLELNPALIRKVVREAQDDIGAESTERRAKAVQKELSTIKRRIERWYSAFEQEALAADELMERVKDLRDRKKILEQELEDTAKHKKESDNRYASIEKTTAALKNFSKLYDKATVEEQTAIIRSIVKKVEVYQNDTVKIHINM